MRSKFPGYYRPTDDQFKELWENAVFSYDANILLNLYEVTPATRDLFFEIIEKLKLRSWLTHQAAFEYHKNTPKRIADQVKRYGGKELLEILDNLEREIKPSKQHPILDPAALVAIVQTARTELTAKLNDETALGQYKSDCDVIKNKLADIFEARVGEPYKENDLVAAHARAKERLDKKIPPGYMDAKKGEPESLGDGLIWNQLLDFAKSQTKNIIFVTDDDKEDWWWEHDGKKQGPRPELANEMLLHADAAFYMYSSEQFLKHAKGHLDLKSSESEVKTAVSEVMQLKREKEQEVKASFAKYLKLGQAWMKLSDAPQLVMPQSDYVRCPNCRERKLRISQGGLDCTRCDYIDCDYTEALSFNRLYPPFIMVKNTEILDSCCADQSVLQVELQVSNELPSRVHTICFACGKREKYTPIEPDEWPF